MVEMIVPLKQGLKQPPQWLILTVLPVVEMIVPLKQGLKHYHARVIENRCIVEMIVPLKQGLKLLVEFLHPFDFGKLK